MWVDDTNASARLRRRALRERERGSADIHAHHVVRGKPTGSHRRPADAQIAQPVLARAHRSGSHQLPGGMITAY
jgi:hypothetical protein